MGYTVVDLINKAIDNGIRKKIIFKSIEKESPVLSIKMVSRVLAKEIDRTNQYYDMLKRDTDTKNIEEIDLKIYDKISSLISEFNEKVHIRKINNVREYLNFSLGLEKDTYALIIDIRGRFVRNKNDVHTKTYKILSDIINYKAGHIATLQKILKQS